MGDRGNIAFKTTAEPLKREHVWLYSHWNGSELLERLQLAMQSDEAQSRLRDAPYLTRILIDRIIPDHTGETDWGISTSVGDNEHPVVEVDIPNQTIYLRSFDFGKAWDVEWDKEPLKAWTFKEFVTVDLSAALS